MSNYTHDSARWSGDVTTLDALAEELRKAEAEVRRLIMGRSYAEARAINSENLVRRLQAELAALKAQTEALKCCANCLTMSYREDPTCRQGGHFQMQVDPWDPCHFTPTRWQERK